MLPDRRDFDPAARSCGAISARRAVAATIEASSTGANIKIEVSA
jgi:hypothetical protein